MEKRHTAPADPAALGLKLIRYELPAADPVTDWYNQQAAAEADALLGEAAAWFEKEPLLGILSPSVPLYAGCTAARRAQWLTALPALREKAPVPVDEAPLPAPNCGWMLVRESAFPDGIPECKTQLDAWRLALTAQENGAYAAPFETAAQAVARADILNAYENRRRPARRCGKAAGTAYQAQTAKNKRGDTQSKATSFSIWISSAPWRWPAS